MEHIIDPKEHAKAMYNKLQAEIIKQSSGSNANNIRYEVVHKLFKDPPMIENFKKHLTYYRTKNAALHAAGAGMDDARLAWILLNSFKTNNNPIWTMASISIATSDTPINQWLFNIVTGKLHEALLNGIPPTEMSTSGTNQMALNAATSKMKPSCYSGPPCTHPGCHCPKSHATEDCWTKEREKQEKMKQKKHKVKKAKKRIVESSSSSEVDSDSDTESDSEPPPRKHHHAH